MALPTICQDPFALILKTYGQGKQARKGQVRSRSRETTGTWLTQPPASQQQTNRAPRYGYTGAPFGTDVDVRPGQTIGFAGNQSGNIIF